MGAAVSSTAGEEDLPKVAYVRVTNKVGNGNFISAMCKDASGHVFQSPSEVPIGDYSEYRVNEGNPGGPGITKPGDKFQVGVYRHPYDVGDWGGDTTYHQTVNWDSNHTWQYHPSGGTLYYTWSELPTWTLTYDSLG